MRESYSEYMKIHIMGDAKSGKSSLRDRIINDRFTTSYIELISDGPFVRNMEINNRVIKIQIEDAFKANERFRSISENRAFRPRGTHGLIMTVDLTDKNGIEMARKYYKEVKEHGGYPEDLQIILVGTKSDITDQRKILDSDVRAFAKELEIPYFETSAKTGNNVIEIFQNLVQLILKKRVNTLGLPPNSKELSQKQSLGPIASKTEKTEINPIRKAILDAVKNGDLNYVREYCADGRDRKKFIEVLTLAKNDIDNKNENLNGQTAVMIAAKNRHNRLLSFIIENAMKDDEGQILLTEHLLLKNSEGKNVLHVAALIPDNNDVISQLCSAAKNLVNMKSERSVALNDYVNSKEDERGSTALHIAARYVIWDNFRALMQANANINSQAINGMSAIDLVPFNNDINASIYFMKRWIQTPDGDSYFKNRHGTFSGVSPDLLDKIIKIDLNASLQQNSNAQMEAFKDFMELLPMAFKVKSPQECNLILSTLGYINFSAIEEGNLKGTENIIANLLKTIINNSKVISTEDKELKNNYIRAEILRDFIRHFKGLPDVTREVFEYYTQLLKKYPQLALDGFKKIDLTLIQDPLKVAKRLVVAHANIVLNDIKINPAKNSLLRFFKKDDDVPSTNAIENFLSDLREVTSLNDINALVNKLPNEGKIGLLKKEMLNELSTQKLLTLNAGLTSK